MGLSHQAAPVSVREAVAAKPGSHNGLNAAVAHACGLSDVVVLSTCSRFEVYATATEKELERILAWFNKRAGRDLSEYLYVKRGQAVMTHILRVAGGLDSWIIGETEIIGQIKSAYQAACAEETVSRNSHLAFQRSLNIGKKIRNETRIVGGIRSIGGAASIMARRIFSDLSSKNILVFGAGTMAESTVRHLCAKGVKGVWVANRSYGKAEALALNLGGRALTLEEGMAKLEEADIAVFSTGASEHLLTAQQAREISKRRGGRTLFVIDLGMPRNVDPKSVEAPNVYLYDMDDLKRIVHESMSRRKADTDAAEGIIVRESLDLWERLIAPPAPRPSVEWPKPSRRQKILKQA